MLNRLYYALNRLIGILWSELIWPSLQPICNYIKYIIQIKIMRRLFQGKRKFEWYTNIRFKIQKLRYSAPANPWKPIMINPSEIEYYANPSSKTLGLGRIKKGTWDKQDNITPINEIRIVKGLRQRYVQGMEWEETEYFKLANEKFHRHNEYWNYQTIDEFLTIRCVYVDNLYDSIKNNGYRPNFQSSHNVPATDLRNDEKQFSQNLEPLVSIGRDGDIFIQDGLHRFVIAQILNIESIPVNVITRHKKWQQIRNQLNDKDKIKGLDIEFCNYLNHPDLEDVTPNEK